MTSKYAIVTGAYQHEIVPRNAVDPGPSATVTITGTGGERVLCRCASVADAKEILQALQFHEDCTRVVKEHDYAEVNRRTIGIGA